LGILLGVVFVEEECAYSLGQVLHGIGSPVEIPRGIVADQALAELLLAARERELRREIRWVYARAVLFCLGWLAIALAAIDWAAHSSDEQSAAIDWAVHSSDEQSAAIAFWGGLLLGNGGILATLFLTCSRAMAEGWL